MFSKYLKYKNKYFKLKMKGGYYNQDIIDIIKNEIPYLEIITK